MKKMVGMVVLALLSHAMVGNAQQRAGSPVVSNQNTQEVTLTIEEAQRLVEAWDRVEAQLRAPRADTSNDAAAQPCCNNADLAAIRTCICAIKNQLCVLTTLVGSCTDPVIPAVTDAACITQDEISAICASLQSWVKTIVSELRGNQVTCPVGPG
jgi:hypothetical protein